MSLWTLHEALKWVRNCNYVNTFISMLEPFLVDSKDDWERGLGPSLGTIRR